MYTRNFAKDMLFGLAVGDALGVPVEFSSREKLKENPVTEMTGYGMHHLPAGTWSDDSSMTFCMAEALADGYDLQKIADNFVKWYYEDYWTPFGHAFDIGNTTRAALYLIKRGTSPDLSGSAKEEDNGNGSLMRILPLILHIKDMIIEERYKYAKEVSGITHAHIRSILACFYYLEFARQIINGTDKFEIYKNLQAEMPTFLNSIFIDREEIACFDRLLKEPIFDFPEEKISSSGYVIHTLEAGIFCLLTTENYKDAVLKSVNLGLDSDTTGAVCGGLAGLLYGHENIPEGWKNTLARKGNIENLAERLSNYSKHHLRSQAC